MLTLSRVQVPSSMDATAIEGNLPAEVSLMSTLRRVQVPSPMDATVNVVAYQTSVKIGGRVFGGLLYHQGPNQQSFNNANNSIELLHHNPNLNSVEIQTPDGDRGASASATTLAATADDELFLP